MAKGHRLLKKLKSEKSKVKLKGSQHLPKGTNVTDASFKIKRIVIREQLRTSAASEPLSKRKLNLKELLSRLQHYNSSVRTEALNDLKELVVAHAQGIVPDNLSLLLQGVVRLVLDKEKSVRRDALKLINTILSLVGPEKISPFFDTLCSYLRCAMTHIDVNIQQDSLLLLDDLLTAVPASIAENSAKILPDFFDLITKQSSDSKAVRTVSINLGNKITDVKWRIEVLDRLHGIMDAVINQKMNKNDSSQGETKSNIVGHVESQHVPLYRNDYLSPVFRMQDAGAVVAVDANDLVMISYIEVVARLLFDTWLEIGPDAKILEHNLDSTLTEEAYDVLNCTLNIFLQIWKYIDLHERDVGNNDVSSKFTATHRRNFSDYIVKLFPYTRMRKRKRNENKRGPFDPGCTNENLLICTMFFVFNKKILHRHQEENVKKVGRYIISCLLHKNLNQAENMENLLLVLRTLFVDTSKSWSECNIDSSQILEGTVKFYETNELKENTKCDLFNILCDIVHHQHLNKTPAYQVWLSKLPELLLKSRVSSRIIDMVCLLTKQKNTSVINTLNDKFPQILSNIHDIKIIECDAERDAKYKIIFLFYWLPIYNYNLNAIKDFVESTPDEAIGTHLKDLLDFRYKMKDEQVLFKYINSM